jgi:hypothetical protein
MQNNLTKKTKSPWPLYYRGRKEKTKDKNRDCPLLGEVRFANDIWLYLSIKFKDEASE